MVQVNVDELIERVAGYLRQRRSYEESEGLADAGLSGLLIVTNDLIRLKSCWKSSESAAELLNQAWEWVFALPTLSDRLSPKCKFPDTRVACFDLIVQLCKGVKTNIARVYEWLTLQHTKGSYSYKWPDSIKR